jgi:copper chaperone NosL
MAISQKQFAAEIVDVDGNATKFDDIGCMLNFAKRNPAAAATFVMDYSDRRWLNANEASFVRGGKIATPMNGGIVALGDRARAEQIAREFGGTVATFADLKASADLKQ